MSRGTFNIWKEKFGTLGLRAEWKKKEREVTNFLSVSTLYPWSFGECLYMAEGQHGDMGKPRSSIDATEHEKGRWECKEKTWKD